MLENIKDKITRLIALYEREKLKNDEYVKEKYSLIKTIDDKNKKIKELENKIEYLQLVDAFKNSEADKQEARKKITKIVREIEKCIAMLNN